MFTMPVHILPESTFYEARSVLHIIQTRRLARMPVSTFFSRVMLRQAPAPWLRQDTGKCYYPCIQIEFRSAGMTTMSIRGLDDHVLAQLKNQASQEGSSLNSLVLRLLQGSGKPVQTPALKKFDDLDALAGTWSDEDAAAFAHHTAAFSGIDPVQWH